MHFHGDSLIYSRQKNRPGLRTMLFVDKHSLILFLTEKPKEPVIKKKINDQKNEHIHSKENYIDLFIYSIYSAAGRNRTYICLVRLSFHIGLCKLQHKRIGIFNKKEKLTAIALHNGHTSLTPIVTVA